MDPVCQEIIPRFKEIEPDSSKISQDLREIQKTAQNYDNNLYGVPQEIKRISSKQDEMLIALKDIQCRVEKLEQQPSYSRRRSIYFGEVEYPKEKVEEEPRLTQAEAFSLRLRELKKK